MPLHSLDPREKEQNVNVFYDRDNKHWYYRRALDDLPTGHYATEDIALAAARVRSNLGHVHSKPCEKFESPYAENGPGVYHTHQLECLVCFWRGDQHG